MRKLVTQWMILFASLLLSQTAAAAAGTDGVLNQVTNEFMQASTNWAQVITTYATWLFWTLATISLVWTFGFMAMRKADMGEFFAEFIRFVLFTGFYLWLLRNGPGFAMDIVRSLMTIGSKAGGVDELNPSTPISIGFEIVAKAAKSVSIFKPGDSLAIVLVCLIILLCLAAVAANVLMVLVTAWIMAYAGMFVLGFGGSRWTSDIAIGYFRAVAGIAMKLLAMTLMIGIATSVMDGLLKKIDGSASIEQLLVPCVVSFVLAMLIHTLPNIIAGLIPGGGGAAGATGSYSAGSMASAGMQVAGTASKMAGSVLSGGASMLGGMAGSIASGMTSGAQSMYSAFRGMQSTASGGMAMATQMAGMLGGGKSSDGGSSPLTGAMGLASMASGGMGSVSAASPKSPDSLGGEQSSGSEASGGSSEVGSGGSDVATPGKSGDAGSGSFGPSQHSGSSTPAQKALANGQSSSAKANFAGNERQDGSSGSGTRIAQQLASNMSSGSEQRVQASTNRTTAGKAGQTSSFSSGNTSTGLDTSSSSRDFDPVSEVANFRESKQERP